MNLFARTTAVLAASLAPMLLAATGAAAAGTSSTAVIAHPARLAVAPAHWGPADCCGGYDGGGYGYGGYGYGGYGGACGGMYFHDGYWYDNCGDVLTEDPNSWPHDS
ncbi:MAG TPA: hypothetical protein VHV82_21075 [Sporichthyaceae bacterium]|jgi:hypothetical protein|nr:hypothetical protein [Sporichthyaceae bacterium]